MIPRLALPVVLAAALASPAPAAKADFVVIDFEALRQEDALAHDRDDRPYTEDGFTLTADHFEPGNPHRLSTFGIFHPNYPGSTAMFHGVGQGEIILTKADGGAFNLVSIDLAALPAGAFSDTGPEDPGPFPLTFYGIRADGQTVTNTFTVDSFLTLETHYFAGFNSVLSVHWFAGAGPPASPSSQFDNIVAGPANPVPAPASVVLLGAGGIVLAASRLIRRQLG